MTNSAVTISKGDRAAAAYADKNPVYKTVVREMKTLQNTVESPSGNWTLIKERTGVTSGFNQKLK